MSFSNETNAPRLEPCALASLADGERCVLIKTGFQVFEKSSSQCFSLVMFFDTCNGIFAAQNLQEGQVDEYHFINARYHAACQLSLMQLSRFNNCPWKDGQGASMRTARQSDLGIGWPRVKPFQCATERKQGQDQQNGSPMIWYRHSDGRFSPRLLAEAIARVWLVHLDLPHERERGPFVCSQLYPRNQFTCQQPNDSSNYISSSLRTAMVVEVVACMPITRSYQILILFEEWWQDTKCPCICWIIHYLLERPSYLPKQKAVCGRYHAVVLCHALHTSLLHYFEP
ncbi:hypothetical protein E2P81_ATG07442 [Venturia nashicola]|nr:hypothetical protein E2P81_ATG07442 [Venturia nashicola]